ncbi:adenylate kinase [Sediminicola luteus]|uniref:Adenylate kinase n=1 Tax=Sediminicola luteus TaxID=319238 RepID=A0A2A4G805_9FLAO|nr:adenylate kinase [Sediminicola luteus]PCE64563.1 adenylate kinase [Sediminicola luteus]
MIRLKDKYFKPYLTEDKVQEIVKKVALRIAEDHKDEVPVFVGVLNGSFMFVADLLKHYPYPCEVAFVKLASYAGLTSTGLVQTLLDMPEDLEGRTVLIVEDIIDTGKTLEKLVDMLEQTNVKKYKIVSLLLKPEVYNGDYDIDYVGLEIPNKFVVGYGLDYDELGRNLQEIYQLNDTDMINLVLFGKPGAGKGTQATFLKEKYNLVHISTGDLFRYNIKNGTDLGNEAKSYIDQGQLVPDAVTIGMLEAEVDKNPNAQGFIFDGFPRTTAQAEALDTFLEGKGMKIDATIALEADNDILTARLLERGKVSGRTDDQDETKIRARFEEYTQKTAPLQEFYTAQDKFHSVDGIGAIEEITGRLAVIIDGLVAVNK